MTNSNKGFKSNPLSSGLGNLAKLAQDVASQHQSSPVEIDNMSENDDTAISSSEIAKTDKSKKKRSQDSFKRGERAVETTNNRKGDAVKAAERGCKKGYARHTYILPIEVIEQIKNMSINLGLPETAIVEQLLSRSIKEVVQKHGKKIVDSDKKKSLF